MHIFWVSIEVHLGRKITLVSDDGLSARAHLSGFVQELGCTAEDESLAKELVRAHVAGYDLGPEQPRVEVIFSSIDELDEVDVEDVEASKLLQPIEQRGIFFTTARSFY